MLIFELLAHGLVAVKSTKGQVVPTRNLYFVPGDGVEIHTLIGENRTASNHSDSNLAGNQAGENEGAS